MLETEVRFSPPANSRQVPCAGYITFPLSVEIPFEQGSYVNQQVAPDES